MKKYNAKNTRITREYYIFLKEAKRQNESSIDAVAKAISRFDEYNKYKDFKGFHYQQAIGFKNQLMKQKNKVTDKPLSKATLNSTLRHLKGFFQWLAMQSGYKSKINYSDAEYFNLSEKDTRIANAKRTKPPATMEQITHVLSVMPTSNSIELRNRALIAFTLLTGARDSAIASLKLKHIDLVNNNVFQDARDVNTKFSKTFTTYFFPVGEQPLVILRDWVAYLKTELLFGLDDPLFPRTKLSSGADRKFAACGLTHEHWTTGKPIASIFKQAFKRAELPYFNPHSFRHTLARLGEQLCQTPEEFKAWSQNLGHEGVLTTLYNYGTVEDYRQAELIKKLSQPRESQSADIEATIEATIKKMMNTNKA